MRLRFPRLPRKRWLIGAVVAILVAGVVAYAAVPVTFVSHTIVTAADLNSNFSNLDTRLTGVEGKIGNGFGVVYGFCASAPATGVPCDGGISCAGHVYAGGCKSDHNNALVGSYPNATDGTQKKWNCLYSPNDSGQVWALCGP